MCVCECVHSCEKTSSSKSESESESQSVSKSFYLLLKKNTIDVCPIIIEIIYFVVQNFDFLCSHRHLTT